MHFLRESFSSVAKCVGIGIAVFVISVGISILISGPIVDYTFPPRKPMPGFLIFPANSGNQLVLFLWLFVFSLCTTGFISGFILGRWQYDTESKILLGGLSGFIVGASGPFLLAVFTLSPFMLIVGIIFGIPAFIFGIVGYIVGRAYERRSSGKIKYTIGVSVFVVIVMILPTIRYVKGMPLNCPPSCTEIDLSGYDLSRIIFNKVNLSGSILKDADLREADLMEANLVGTSLVGTNLTFANLNGADLRSANLSNAILINTNLKAVDFSNAVLMRVDLRGANLTDANLEATNMDGAIYNDKTVWPEDFEVEQSGAVFK